jgi:hypothetical protein
LGRVPIPSTPKAKPPRRFRDGAVESQSIPKLDLGVKWPSISGEAAAESRHRD